MKLKKSTEFIVVCKNTALVEIENQEHLNNAVIAIEGFNENLFHTVTVNEIYIVAGDDTENLMMRFVRQLGTCSFVFDIKVFDTDHMETYRFHDAYFTQIKHSKFDRESNPLEKFGLQDGNNVDVIKTLRLRYSRVEHIFMV
jgi:hypothetical protein